MEVGVSKRVIDALGLPGDYAQKTKPSAVSLVRVRSTDNLRGGEETHIRSFGGRSYKIKEACKEKYDLKECCAGESEASPPQYLSEEESFNLSKLICKRLDSKEIQGIGDEIFLKFIDQALLDIKYLDSWVEKLILNKKKLPNLLVVSFVENMIGCRSSYAILVKDLMLCKKYFEYNLCEHFGGGVGEVSKFDGYSLNQDERCSMVHKLASCWSYLLKYMSQCNEVMPAPSSISELGVIDIEHPLDLREPTFESIAEVKVRLEELKACWLKLNQWLLTSPGRLFVKKADEPHCVMLRVDSRFIPGTLDIHELGTEKNTPSDGRARAMVNAQWLVPKNTWEFSVKDPLANVVSQEHNSTLGNKPFTMESSGACSSTSAVQYCVVLKPADYPLYQPIMKKLMADICGMNVKRLSSLEDRIKFFRDNSCVKPLTSDEKKDLKDFAKVLETSRVWWNTESPSVRSIFDQIFLEEKKRSSLKKGVINLVTKFKSHVKVGRSNSDKVLDKRLKVSLAVRPCSLRERDIGLKTLQVPKITFTPASPEHKPKD